MVKNFMLLLFSAILRDLCVSALKLFRNITDYPLLLLSSLYFGLGSIAPCVLWFTLISQVSKNCVAYQYVKFFNRPPTNGEIEGWQGDALTDGGWSERLEFTIKPLYPSVGVIFETAVESEDRF